uniref:Uncharacterized protein n=1 Tax=Rhizophora mucronata TaxID=61149 RepID=A0A2P2P5W1_RHIMU
MTLCLMSLYLQMIDP